MNLRSQTVSVNLCSGPEPGRKSSFMLRGTGYLLRDLIRLCAPGALKRGNQYAFKATPFIVRLPNFVGENHDGVNDDEDVWNYDVIAVPKEYTVSLYTVYYNDNRQSIGNREVTQMPQPSFEQFDIGSSRLFTAPHSSDPLEPYVRRSGAGDTDKNRCRLLYAEPQAEGYEFVYWVESLTYQNAWQYVSGITENLNNEAIMDLARTDSRAITAMAVFLAPLTEEMLFRGAIFGGIRKKNRIAAYAVSMLLFSVYHTWGYAIDDPSYWLYTIQYLPAAYLLCRCYERTNSIWCSIFFHMLVNHISMRMLTILEELL